MSELFRTPVSLRGFQLDKEDIEFQCGMTPCRTPRGRPKLRWGDGVSAKTIQESQFAERCSCKQLFRNINKQVI